MKYLRTIIGDGSLHLDEVEQCKVSYSIDIHQSSVGVQAAGYMDLHDYQSRGRLGKTIHPENGPPFNITVVRETIGQSRVDIKVDKDFYGFAK